jgi:hypothetical protein
VIDPTWNGVLLAGAAVFAAAVAAWTANRRIDKQLDAEAKRLDKQLAHDRWMREVAELRGMVDEAARAGLGASNLVHVFRNQVRWIVEDAGEPNELYASKLRTAQDAVAEMQGFVERFELRLGWNHEVPVAFGSWQLAMEEALECFETQPAQMSALRNGGERLRDSANRYLSFMEAARPYVRLEPLT